MEEEFEYYNDSIISETEYVGNSEDNSSFPDSDAHEIIYCGAGWHNFRIAYANIHGYTSLAVCFFGCFANLLNLIVLTRKGMISPTNAILTGLALADLLNMIEYIPFAFRMYIWPVSGRPSKTYGLALFLLVHSNFSQTTHTVAIWLTLTLAVWRYIAVGQPQRSVYMCTMDRAKWAIIAAYLFSPILCTPLYLSFSINEYNITDKMSNTTEPETGFHLGFSELAKANHNLLTNINFWIYSVVIKLIPCLLLSLVSWRLIHAMVEAKKRKQMLMSKRNVGNSAVKGHNETTSDRTTKMLLAVLILFLITEFPQGLLGLLSCILGDTFFKHCYVALGEMMDMVALLNSGINFILYCVMSRKFRETFWEVFFLDEFCKKASSLPKHNAATLSTTV